MLKLLGALFVVFGCGSAGFALAQSYRKEEAALSQLIHALKWMSWELSYRMPALGNLCSGVSEQCQGALSQLFSNLSLELQQQITPDAAVCMLAAILKTPRRPSMARKQLLLLGQTLGRFDLQGQLSGLSACEAQCQRELDNIRCNSQLRLRNYQTLGLCAGIGLVILLL